MDDVVLNLFIALTPCKMMEVGMVPDQLADLAGLSKR